MENAIFSLSLGAYGVMDRVVLQRMNLGVWGKTRRDESSTKVYGKIREGKNATTMHHSAKDSWPTL